MGYRVVHLWCFGIVVCDKIPQVDRFGQDMHTTPVKALPGNLLQPFLGIIFAGAIVTMYMKYFGSPGVVSESWMASFLLDKFPIVLGLLPKEFDSVKSYFQ